MWHASVKSKAGDMRLAEEMARAALDGVGYAALGEWREAGTAFHIRRRLTAEELKLAGNLTVRDIRGTREERKRFALLFADVPWLRAALKAHGL